MTDRVITTDDHPGDTVIVNEDHHHAGDAPKSNTVGIVIAVIAIAIILLMLLRIPFGGNGGGADTTNVNVPSPTTNLPTAN